MKTLFLLFLFLSNLTWAATTYPVGMFKIDPGYSRMILDENVLEVRGQLEVKDARSETNFRLQTDHGFFTSTSLRGNDNELILEGVLEHQGKETAMMLKGRFLGKIITVTGEVKTAFRFSNERMSLRIFAVRPTTKTRAIYRIVETNLN